MEDTLGFPMEKRVGLKIEDLFNWKSKIYNQDMADNDGIAMVKDSETKLYYVTIYHKAGWLIPTYLQSFDGKLGALVIYDKLKRALYSGGVAECWKVMTEQGQKKGNLCK
jgi:hypothetical protein